MRGTRDKRSFAAPPRKERFFPEISAKTCLRLFAVGANWRDPPLSVSNGLRQIIAMKDRKYITGRRKDLLCTATLRQMKDMT